MKVELPKDLIEMFEASAFCPGDGINGRPETGTGWNVIHVEYHEGSEHEYPEGAMYLHYHKHEVDGKESVHKASSPFASPDPETARFIKGFVDWMQSMTMAKNINRTSP